MLWLPFVAQVDPISGGAGWVGAGLLGSVLAWLLLKHLPDKDRQMSEKDKQHNEVLMDKDKTFAAILAEKDRHLLALIAAKDAQLEVTLERKWRVVQELSKEYKEVMQGMSKEYKDSLASVVVHCETETSRIANMFQTEVHHLTQAVQDLSLKIDERFGDEGRRFPLPVVGPGAK